jgi:hypothetical protein
VRGEEVVMRALLAALVVAGLLAAPAAAFDPG